MTEKFNSLMEIKVEEPGQRNYLFNKLPRRAHLDIFIIFYYGSQLMTELLVNSSPDRVAFLKRVTVLNDQHQLSGAEVLDRDRYLSWFCPVLHRAEHDGESVNPGNMKLFLDVVQPQAYMQGCRQRGGSGARSPNLNRCPPISRLAPLLLHTSNTVF